MIHDFQTKLPETHFEIYNHLNLSQAYTLIIFNSVESCQIGNSFHFLKKCDEWLKALETSWLKVINASIMILVPNTNINDETVMIKKIVL